MSRDDVNEGSSNTPARTRMRGKELTNCQSCHPPEGVFEVLERLRAGGVTFTVDRGRLLWTPEPTAAGRAWLAPWEALLFNIALGRRTGHAPARCSVCGRMAMVAIVSSSGTRRGRKSAPFPRCRQSNLYVAGKVVRGWMHSKLVGCPGVMVIAEEDFAGVARRRPPGIPTLKVWRAKHEQ